MNPHLLPRHSSIPCPSHIVHLRSIAWASHYQHSIFRSMPFRHLHHILYHLQRYRFHQYIRWHRSRTAGSCPCRRFPVRAQSGWIIDAFSVYAFWPGPQQNVTPLLSMVDSEFLSEHRILISTSSPTGLGCADAAEASKVLSVSRIIGKDDCMVDIGEWWLI